MHHSAFLQKLLEDGRLVMKENNSLTGQTITYHDSCYLGRANDVYEAPRVVIESLKVELREMKNARPMVCVAVGVGHRFLKKKKKEAKELAPSAPNRLWKRVQV